MHGTSSKFVQAIETQGIDARFAGDQPLFGRGAYYAESSTKADQYTSKYQVLIISVFSHLPIIIFLLWHRHTIAGI